MSTGQTELAGGFTGAGALQEQDLAVGAAQQHVHDDDGAIPAGQ
ncbi:MULTISPECIES: hypothetical protein [Micromonospora]|nr:hypothetical protein [Micromonospora maris]